MNKYVIKRWSPAIMTLEIWSRGRILAKQEFTSMNHCLCAIANDDRIATRALAGKPAPAPFDPEPIEA